VTLVTAPIAVGISRILGIPPVARIIAGSSGAAVKLNPDVAIALPFQRPATAGFPALLVDRIANGQRKQRNAEPAEPPSVGRIVAKQTDLLSLRGHHV